MIGPRKRRFNLFPPPLSFFCRLSTFETLNLLATSCFSAARKDKWPLSWRENGHGSVSFRSRDYAKRETPPSPRATAIRNPSPSKFSYVRKKFSSSFHASKKSREVKSHFESSASSSRIDRKRGARREETRGKVALLIITDNSTHVLTRNPSIHRSFSTFLRSHYAHRAYNDRSDL